MQFIVLTVLALAANACIKQSPIQCGLQVWVRTKEGGGRPTYVSLPPHGPNNIEVNPNDAKQKIINQATDIHYLI